MSDDLPTNSSEQIYSEHKDADSELQIANGIYNNIDAAPAHTSGLKEGAVRFQQEAQSAYDQNIEAGKQAINEMNMIQQATEIKKLLESENVLKDQNESYQNKIDNNQEEIRVYKEVIAENLKKLDAIEKIKATLKLREPLPQEVAQPIAEPIEKPPVKPAQEVKPEDSSQEALSEIHLRSQPDQPTVTELKSEKVEIDPNATVGELIEAGGNQALQETSDKVRVDTGNVFNQNELTTKELTGLADLLSNKNSQEVFTIVKKRLGKLANEKYKRIFTEKDREALRDSKAGFKSMDEQVANTLLDEKYGPLLNKAEINKINEFITRKKDTENRSPHIEEPDRDALLLILRAYGQSVHENDFEEEEFNKFYNNQMKDIIDTGKSDIDTPKIANILLTSDYLLNKVIPQRRLQKRKQKIAA